jgi:hypothetical protein
VVTIVICASEQKKLELMLLGYWLLDVAAFLFDDVKVGQRKT